MLHRARERGDRPEAERAWRLIVEAELERVRGLVLGYRNSVLPGGRIPAADVDDVAANVFIRLHDKSGALKGHAAGQLRAFMRTATDFTCRDYVRVFVADDKHRGGSLDAEAGAGVGNRAASDRALARLAEHLAADDDEAEIARAIIHPALALVDEDKRAVLVMSEAGYTVKEMMERFGISQANVHQRRRRGLTQLRDAISELAGEDVNE